MPRVEPPVEFGAAGMPTVGIVEEDVGVRRHRIARRREVRIARIDNPVRRVVNIEALRVKDLHSAAPFAIASIPTQVIAASRPRKFITSILC